MSARRDDLAYAVGLVAGILVVIASGFLQTYATHVGANDWSGIWAGPRAFLDGSDPYDARTWVPEALAIQRQKPDTSVYGYPAWTLLALLPLGALPYAVAGAIWTVLGLVAAVLGLRSLLRAFAPGLPGVHLLSALMLTASQPAIVGFYTGQWAFLLLGITSAAVVALRRHRGTLAGIGLACAALAKPQLYLVAAPAILRAALARRVPRVAVAFVALSVAALAASLLILPGWVAAYTGVAGGRLPGTPKFATLPAALDDLVGTPGLVLAAAIALLLVGAAILFDPGTDAALAVGLAASFAVAPYAWSYDQLLLIAPVVIATGILARRSPRRALALITACAVLLLIVATILHAAFNEARRSESYNGVIPSLVALLVVGSLWPHRTSG